MKKVLSIVLSLVMVLCMVPTMAFADTAAYSDIAGTDCEASVELLKELGVVDGYEDGTYQPEGTVTRAEMAKLIVTQLGLKPTSSTTAFTDMAGASWAIPYVGYAESLNIIKGRGDGTFGPNDPVSYDEVITMIVRAIGYTEACNEMQGNWPAVFVQKANELGILKKIATTGDGGANRGDVAIMLANALYVPMVYADNEGETKLKLNEYGFEGVTMMDTLIEEAYDGYGVVYYEDVVDATKDITGLLGAAGKIVYNEDLEIISVSDIKSTFMTGKYNADAKVFTMDGVDYKISANASKSLDGKGKAYSVDEIPVFTNGDVTTAAGITSLDTGKMTLAGNISGKTITEIFSIQIWNIPAYEGSAAVVDESDLDQMDINKTLLGYEFVTNTNGEIDGNTFILSGVDSLADIEVDDIVYVYANDAENITKVEVSDNTETGTIDKISTDGEKYTIDGTQYEIVAAEMPGQDIDDAAKAGDEVKVGFGPDGKIYTLEIVEGTGNYAVIVAIDKSKTPDKGTNALDATTSKIQLLTPDGVKIYTAGIDYDKSTKKEKDPSTAWADLEPGTIVKFTVNDNAEITKIFDQGLDGDYSGKITAKGYVDSTIIADNAVIFAAPITDGDDPDFVWNDTDKLAVVSKNSVLGVNAGLVHYVLNDDGNKIVAMIVADNSVAKDEFGVATSLFNIAKDKIGANVYIASEETKDIVVSGDEPELGTSMLYKIKQTAAGEYTFEEADEITTEAAVKIKSKTVYTAEDLSIGDLADDLVVYVYDESAEKYTIGTKSDMIAKGIIEVGLYSTPTDDDDENYGLIDFVVVVRE